MNFGISSSFLTLILVALLQQQAEKTPSDGLVVAAVVRCPSSSVLGMMTEDWRWDWVYLLPRPPRLEKVAFLVLEADSLGLTGCPAQEVTGLTQVVLLSWAVESCFGFSLARAIPPAAGAERRRS